MSELRKYLDSARSDYQAVHFQGDLAHDLLGNRLRIVPALPRWKRFAPLLIGAMAAMIAVVVWHHQETPGSRVSQLAIQPAPPAAVPPVPWPNPMPRLREAHYESYVTDMRSGMREAVQQLSGNVEGALDAPLVTGSVATVRHVAGELQEFALVTWSQLRPRREPGC